MHLRYDEEVDVLVVALGPLTQSVGAQEIAPGVWLDQSADGTVLGLEILGASRRYPADGLRQHPARYDRPILLADAAATLGVTPQALQKAILRGRLAGEKVGNAWTTTIEALHQYSASRAPRGPGKRVAERTASQQVQRRSP